MFKQTEPRKVLYFSANSSLGGAEKVTELIARHHKREKWEPQFFFLSRGPFSDDMERAGFVCHFAAASGVRFRNPLSILKVGTQMAQVIRERRIDLVHSVMGYAHVMGALAAQIAGIPEVWFQHGPTGPSDRWISKIPTRRILTNSDHITRLQLQYSGKKPICQIGLGIEALNPDDWLRESRKFKEDLLDGAIVFGLFGRITPLKGQIEFLEASIRLIQRDQRAQIFIVGAPFLKSDFEYFERLRKHIHEFGLESRVRLLGHLSPPFAAMMACDVIVNASTEPEGFGLTLVEAMWLGKPVIAPDCGGPKEIIEDGKEGILFPFRNLTALSTAMGELVVDSEKRVRMGLEGRKKASQRFNADLMTREIEDEYDLILNSES